MWIAGKQVGRARLRLPMALGFCPRPPRPLHALEGRGGSQRPAPRGFSATVATAVSGWPPAAPSIPAHVRISCQDHTCIFCRTCLKSQLVLALVLSLPLFTQRFPGPALAPLSSPLSCRRYFSRNVCISSKSLITAPFCHSLCSTAGVAPPRSQDNLFAPRPFSEQLPTRPFWQSGLLTLRSGPPRSCLLLGSRSLFPPSAFPFHPPPSGVSK